MKVTPWNHCPLEEQQQKLQGGSETEILQVAPSPENNKGLVRGGCTSFSCFGCSAPAGLESPFAPNAGPKKDQREETRSSHDDAIEGDEEKVVGGVRSSLKKSVSGIEGNADSNREEAFGLCGKLNESESEDGFFCAEKGGGRRNIGENRALFEEDCSNDDSAFQAQGRKVQWMDSIGGELFEIREFEMSDDDSDDSDDEFGHGNGKCMCAIM